MALQPGSTLGPYEVLALIGAGGMGEVYRARDTRLRREVALKILRLSIANDPTRLSRLHHEAQVLASLNHPHIGAIYGLEEFEGSPVLVLELVEGDTLAERIARGPMPLVDVVPIATQIAEALEAAHEHGIVHRDLKPANIKVRPDATVKVLDFGLAKALDSASTSSADATNSPTHTLQGTMVGTILGTAAYMAPEQARGERVDKRADIWAFGVVLYEMLTGRRPFGGPTVTDTLAAILTTEPAYDVLPVAARSLVRRCMQKDPKQRLRDIGDARLALTESSPVETGRQPRRSSVMLRSLVGLLSIALVTALWFSRRTAPPPGALLRLNLTLDTAAPTLTADGTRMAFVGPQPNGADRLYTLRLDEEQPVPIIGTEGAFWPFFAPNGRELAYFADGKLKKVSVDGGGPVVLADAPTPRGGHWADDGTIVFAPTATSPIVRVSSDGGMTESLTTLDRTRHELTHRWPQVLPGGQAIVFTAHIKTGGYEDATIEIQSLRTGQRTTLVHGGYFGRYAASGHLLYLRQNTLYAAPMDAGRLALTGPMVRFIDNVTGNPTTGFAPMDITRNGILVYVKGRPSHRTPGWLDRAGHAEALLPAEADCWETRLSPDGNRLALTRYEGGNTDIWMMELDRGTNSRLTSAQGMDSHPVWSPDGTHLVFSSEAQGGPPNLYWMRSDGTGEAVRLTNNANGQSGRSFSPDGTKLLFTQQNSATADLWVLTLEDSHSDHPKVVAAQPFLQTPFTEAEPALSPDGQWVAYRSDESGRNEVYVRPFEGAQGKWAVSTTGGRHPVWSRNEKQLFYGSADGIHVVNFTSSGQTFSAGKPQVWSNKTVEDFDVAPDGKRCIVIQKETPVQQGPAQLTFLVNFFDELRHRVDAAQ